MVSSLGSLSYAEDDNRHIVGIKTTQAVTASLSTGDPLAGQASEANFCCHILECDNEVSFYCMHAIVCYFVNLVLCSKAMVRQICGQVSEQFHGVMLQRQAEEQQQRPEDSQQVKAKMLKRLSKPEPAKPSRRASPESESPRAAMEVSQKQSSPRQHLPPPSSSGDDIMEEIGRHFMAVVTKEPSHRQPRAQGSRGPSVQRLNIEASGRKNKAGRVSDDSIAELLPPIAPGKVAKHDGNVVTQRLQDTTGIKVKEKKMNDYLVPKGKQRALLNPVPSPQVVKMKVGSPSPPKEQRPKSTESNVLRTSLLLEKMEEGEKETRIDGDGKEAILFQTTMGEKETAIVGNQGKAMLLPTSELSQYQEDEKKMETLSSVAPPPTPPFSSVPPPSAPPPPPSSAPLPPPSSPPPPERKPPSGKKVLLSASLTLQLLMLA